VGGDGVVLVTGCSSGVGLWVRPLDVTNREQRVALIREIGETWTGVNVLINKAGISYRAVVEHMTEEEDEHQLATKYLGPMDLIRLVLPHMPSVGRGKIINVSSVSGMLAMPTMSAYSASKFTLGPLRSAKQRALCRLLPLHGARYRTNDEPLPLDTCEHLQQEYQSH